MWSAMGSRHRAFPIGKDCARIAPSEGPGSAKRLMSGGNDSENNAGGRNEGGGCFVRFFEANFRVAEAKREALECEASALTTELTAPDSKLL